VKFSDLSFPALPGRRLYNLAWFRYRNFAGTEFQAEGFNLFKNKYYIDELYNHVVVRNLKQLGWVLWKGIDGLLIDGFLNSLGRGTVQWSDRLKKLQRGLVQEYALWVWFGFFVLLVGSWILGG
jgi:NADH-quinone oxidoreductase subunit L